MVFHDAAMFSYRNMDMLSHHHVLMMGPSTSTSSPSCPEAEGYGGQGAGGARGGGLEHQLRLENHIFKGFCGRVFCKELGY